MKKDYQPGVHGNNIEKNDAACCARLGQVRALIAFAYFVRGQDMRRPILRLPAYADPGRFMKATRGCSPV
jgi:hypothetical protein